MSAYHNDLMATYYAARNAQDRHAESVTIGYATELAEYYRDHPRVTFKRWLSQYARAMREVTS